MTEQWRETVMDAEARIEVMASNRLRENALQMLCEAQAKRTWNAAQENWEADRDNYEQMLTVIRQERDELREATKHSLDTAAVLRLLSETFRTVNPDFNFDMPDTMLDDQLQPYAEAIVAHFGTHAARTARSVPLPEEPQCEHCGKFWDEAERHITSGDKLSAGAWVCSQECYEALDPFATSPTGDVARETWYMQGYDDATNDLLNNRHVDQQRIIAALAHAPQAADLTTEEHIWEGGRDRKAGRVTPWREVVDEPPQAVDGWSDYKSNVTVAFGEATKSNGSKVGYSLMLGETEFLLTGAQVGLLVADLIQVLPDVVQRTQGALDFEQRQEVERIMDMPDEDAQREAIYQLAARTTLLQHGARGLAEGIKSRPQKSDATLREGLEDISHIAHTYRASLTARHEIYYRAMLKSIQDIAVNALSQGGQQ
jgi:hypothetical protein